jgi:Domain of unknown function (DUF397)
MDGIHEGTAGMNWRTASYSLSNGHCVEAASWRTASYSGANGGACVEAGHGAGVVGVRDTRQAGEPERTMIEFSASAWAAFTSSLRA